MSRDATRGRRDRTVKGKSFNLLLARSLPHTIDDSGTLARAPLHPIPPQPQLDNTSVFPLPDRPQTRRAGDDDDRPTFLSFPCSLACFPVPPNTETEKRSEEGQEERWEGRKEEGRGHSFLPSAPQHELGIPLFGGSRQEALAACDQSDLLFGTNGAMLEKVRRSEVSRDDVSGRRENGWMSCRGRSRGRSRGYSLKISVTLARDVSNFSPQEVPRKKIGRMKRLA